jgi:hypothetical protein
MRDASAPGWAATGSYVAGISRNKLQKAKRKWGGHEVFGAPDRGPPMRGFHPVAGMARGGSEKNQHFKAKKFLRRGKRGGFNCPRVGCLGPNILRQGALFRQGVSFVLYLVILDDAEDLGTDSQSPSWG